LRLFPLAIEIAIGNGIVFWVFILRQIADVQDAVIRQAVNPSYCDFDSDPDPGGL